MPISSSAFKVSNCEAPVDKRSRAFPFSAMHLFKISAEYTAASLPNSDGSFKTFTFTTRISFCYSQLRPPAIAFAGPAAAIDFEIICKSTGRF
jgi:hypothetical protein